MKFVLFAIIAFHLVNFGEAQVSISRIMADSCDCTALWIPRTLAYFFYYKIPTSNRPRKVAKKVIQQWDNDGCFDIEDLKDMINVGHSPLTAEDIWF